MSTKSAPAAKAKRPAAPNSAAASAPKDRLIPSSDKAVIDSLDELLGGRPDLKRGAMFGCPGYFVGGKAVACVFGNELNLTVPPARVDELVQQEGFRRFAPGGRTMSGWVLLDQERVAALEPDSELLAEAIACARAKAVAALETTSKKVSKPASKPTTKVSKPANKPTTKKTTRRTARV